MRIAIVMPRGSRMCCESANSMETVALTLLDQSGMKGSIKLICDSGAKTPMMEGLLTVPAGLSKARRNDAVADILKTYKPDYIEYHQQLESSASLASRFPDSINVLYRHTRIKPAGGRIDKIRYSRRLKAFDRLVFVSEAASAEFLGDYPQFQDRVSAVCNPIDAEAWRASVDDRENLILFSGRAMKEKGLEPFCAALAAVLERAPDWRGALMLGDWDRHQAWAEPVIQRLAAFGDRVEIHKSASLAEVKVVTRRAAIAVTPSLVAEALGLAALEAHAAGAALISSGRGGLREASGAHAIYVDPPEPHGLETAMMRLVQNSVARIAMARAAQASVATLHSAEVRSRQLDDLREGLMARSTPHWHQRENILVRLLRRNGLSILPSGKVPLVP